MCVQGFTSKDWLEGVAIVKARESNPSLPIMGVVISGAKAAANKSSAGSGGGANGGAGPSGERPSLSINAAAAAAAKPKGRMSQWFGLVWFGVSRGILV